MTLTKSAIQGFCQLVLSALGLLLLAPNVFGQREKDDPGSKPTTLRVLILSGEGAHDWRTTTPFLRRLLLDSGRFDVRVCESPVGLAPETLAAFDVVVDDYSGARMGSAAETALEAFVSSGKGLVIMHGALASLARQENEAGAGVNGKIRPDLATMISVSWPQTKVEDLEAPFHLFGVKVAQPEHPIMRGINSNLRAADRPCLNFALLSGSEVLARTDKEDPLIFVSTPGKGRTFSTALGHDLASMQERAFITTFLRGTEWAGSGRVTLSPNLGMPEPKADAVRVLVITGGHDHEAAFYGLFEGYKDIGWAPVDTSKVAFQKDLRTNYDVLVFYDFSRDLDEKGKKNLRDFVEDGKGVLVLHHGILNFQTWPWWSEEVVGGRYRLSREGNIPNSTVKFGEEHLITPVGNHPITAGTGPFHVIDETYKGLFISPKIQPLLTTDNPTSDPTVAWVGPCTTSKVVFIQLGHDHSPFRHPSYRALVHNCILWCAGKLK